MQYSGKKLDKISFPLGGIGTGSIGLAGNGRLVDWEIFNRPNKNSENGFSHFAVKAVCDGKASAKVVQGDVTGNLIGQHMDRRFAGIGFGSTMESLAGFPHFSKTKFCGEFPIAELSFSDADFPLKIKLTAFNPFIPHNDFDSSLPAAFFEVEATNVSDRPVDCTFALSLRNPSEGSVNESFAGKATGVHCKCSLDGDDLNYKDMCIATDADDVSYTQYWYRGRWSDAHTVYWRDFCDKERQENRVYDKAGSLDHCSVFAYVKLGTKQKKKVKFVMSWNAPNNYNYWDPIKDENGKDISWKNYYATCFRDSKATAVYALEKFDELKAQTVKFKDALFDSSLPKSFIDAVSANISILKTATVLRLSDGTLYGWEGMHEKEGSCEGTCQHVWNYAYAAPFLFPKLERSLRETVYKYNTFLSGETKFRTSLPLGVKREDKFRACVDGQMGEVIKSYREWRISGDDNWLKDNYESIVKMLDYATSKENGDRWDADADGVLDGRQHHTLDMELFGANSWLQGMYLLALECGQIMAARVGDKDRETKYAGLLENGKKYLNEELFNGKYFVQKIDLKDRSAVDAFSAADIYWNDEKGEIKYQIGDGCEIDQMLADWHANILRLPCVFDKKKKDIALRNLFANNFKSSVRDVANMWRNFTVDDEGGAVICSYPQGATKPAIPIPYCEETMAGFEYALGELLIAEGFATEGKTVIDAIRARYNGENRNPWNEMECGSNYARSMASYALLPVCSGFIFDLPDGRIGFDPLLGGDGRYLWSAGNSWGEVIFKRNKCDFCVYGDPLKLKRFVLPNAEKAEKVFADGKEISFTADGNDLILGDVTIKEKLATVFRA